MTYWAIRNKASGKLMGGPSGTSSAPHLYHTEGKATAAMKTRYRYSIKFGTASFEVVPVELIIEERKS